MAKIEKLWFEDGRIYICTDEKQVLSRPLEAFPSLKDATEQERQDFKIDRFGDAVRWDGIDEDIHISSFYETVEPDYDNEDVPVLIENKSFAAIILNASAPIQKLML